MIVGMKYVILYSEVGYYSNPQNYIVGIEAIPVLSNVVGSASANITVSLSISFSYIFSEPDETRHNSYKEFNFPP